MTNTVIFWTQIISIVGFVIALFVLYRVLVSQKDSTIELLKEKNTFLTEQLKSAQEQSPDKLAELLSSRVSILESELERLGSDKEVNSQEILAKETELATVKRQAENLSKQLAKATALLDEFFCPYCGSAMVERQYQSESVWNNGRDVDIEHEYISFECGYELVDGDPHGDCSRHETSA